MNKQVQVQKKAEAENGEVEKKAGLRGIRKEGDVSDLSPGNQKKRKTTFDYFYVFISFALCEKPTLKYELKQSIKETRQAWFKITH